MAKPDNKNDQDDILVTLDMDDGSQVECEILTIFEVKGQDYIALLPLDEEGNPDFMFQAGGFQVMDSSGDGRIRMYGADEDRAKLLAQEDLDQLASELYTALKNRETTIEVRDYAFF